MAKIDTPFLTKAAEKTMDSKHNLVQRTGNENVACLRRILRKQAAFSFAVLRTSIFWGRRSYQIRYAAHFYHGLAMIFVRDSLCLSAVSLSRQRHDILDFTCCPLSRVLHVILANIGKNLDLSFT